MSNISVKETDKNSIIIQSKEESSQSHPDTFTQTHSDTFFQPSKSNDEIRTRIIFVLGGYQLLSSKIKTYFT